MSAQANDQVGEQPEPLSDALHEASSAEHVSVLDLSPQARAAYPGVSVLAIRLAIDPSWQQAAAPDWASLQPAWRGQSRADVLSHASIAPFCALVERMGVKANKHPPSFANFILRAFTKEVAKIPQINPIVDRVNHAAVSTLTSLGVFDAAAVNGRLHLDLSAPGDTWAPLGGNSNSNGNSTGNGEEALEPGSLVLRDDEKVLSLFGIRDSIHQAVKPQTREVIVLSCGVPGVPDERVRLGLDQARLSLGSMSAPPAAEPAWYGAYGGAFIPATLSPDLDDLEARWRGIVESSAFRQRQSNLMANYVGRATPLMLAENLSEALGLKVYLKREDLAHTGAYKINNAIGQALIAVTMGKTRVVTESGAGQHGVATAAACALLRLECTIYMGRHDIERQPHNVQSMRVMGARVVPVDGGTGKLKDAVNEAWRAWMSAPATTHYLVGSGLGPHPYPLIVREFQKVIGEEVREQFAAAEGGALPDALVACVGGGSNALGLFHPFLEDVGVRMFGVEAGGEGPASGRHAIRLGGWPGQRPGVLHGTRSYLLQDANGQVAPTHSIAAGLDYPMVGPELAYLHDTSRVECLYATDAEALAALHLLARCEGIIPALESAHAIAGAQALARRLPASARIVINLSGRGDKDLAAIARQLPDDS